MASGFARKLCGRKQDEEPQEVVIPLRFEEEMRAQQKARLQPETRVQREQKDDLFDSIKRCDLEHIKTLKTKFSFKNIKDNHKRTPLHVLADSKPEQKGKDGVLKEIFMVLKEAGCDVNCVDQYGNTPVKLAAEKGCIPVLKCLLEEKADVTLPDEHKGDTPIHWSAKNGKYEATNLLITHQRDFINPQNKDKQTPLHLAVQNEHRNIVYLLLVYGADKNLKDKNDFTPLRIAERANNEEIVDLLRKSLEELYKMRAKDGQGEDVEPDSGARGVSIPLIPILPAASITYNVNLVHSVAAIGPNSSVNLRQQQTLSQCATLTPPSTPGQAQQSLSPASSPSTAGSPTAFTPGAATQQILPPASSPSPAGIPTTFSPGATTQHTLHPASSPSPAGSPTTFSPGATTQHTLHPASSPSPAGSPTAFNNVPVFPTAPLSPLSMDTQSPSPSAPPEPEDGV